MAEEQNTQEMVKALREAGNRLMIKSAFTEQPLEEKEWDVLLDLMRGNVIVSREILGEMGCYAYVAEMARECLHIARFLCQQDGFIYSSVVYDILQNMHSCVFERPRLNVRILRFMQKLAHKADYVFGDEEWLKKELGWYETNIAHADAGELDKIAPRKVFDEAHDPIEWTERWEEVIDMVDLIVDQALEGEVRRMGFCHTYWFEREKVLAEYYGIYWRSPQAMCPDAMFD